MTGYKKPARAWEGLGEPTRTELDDKVAGKMTRDVMDERIFLLGRPGSWFL